jgi:hypothetical protein
MSKIGLLLVAGASLLGFTFSAQGSTVVCNTANGGTCLGSISVTLGTPIPNETDIFLKAATGTSFVGNVGANNGPALVSFISPQTVDAANGFATFSSNPNNSVFNQLTISVPTGFVFNDLSFGTLKATDLEVTASNGASFSINDLGSGLNQFLALATNGSEFTSVILHSNSGFSQIKQIQISGLTATPLPGALALLGPVLGLGYCFGFRRRRQRVLAA